MKDDVKLTELTREELRQVSGGKSGGECKCDCSGKKQVFGQEDSASRGTKKPIAP